MAPPRPKMNQSLVPNDTGILGKTRGGRTAGPDGRGKSGRQPERADAVDEFTFRFNRRRSRARGLLFHRLAAQPVAVAPATHRAITGNPPNPGDYRG